MQTSPDRALRLPPLLRWLRGRQFPHKLGLCERWFGRALAREGIAWVRTTPGPVWKLDLADATHRWIVYGDYEGPGLWRWLKSLREPPRTIVDSGANIGQTVLYFASIVPQARIFAYEPGSEARAWLTESVAANRLSQISIESAGLGACADSARLAQSSSPERHGSWNQVSATEGEPITLVSLDDEIDRHGIATVDLWKLDMEGYELQALAGAQRALAAGRIRALYVELGFDHGEQIAALLARSGLQPFLIGDDGSLRPWVGQGNWASALFLPAKT